MQLASHKSTFPVALGLRITGVDDSTYSQTGEAYSAIALPNTDSHVSRVLQADDTALVRTPPNPRPRPRPRPRNAFTPLTCTAVVAGIRVCS